MSPILMRLNFFILFRFLTLCLLGVGSSLLHGQAPLVSNQVVTAEASDSIALEWRIDAAERALRSGLVGLAESGFRAALASPALKLDSTDRLRVRLAAALIAQQRYKAALAELELVADAGKGSQYSLYRAVAIYGDGRAVDKAGFQSSLRRVKPAELDAFDLPWFHLARGLRAELTNDLRDIVPAFEKAVEVSRTAEQKAFFDSLVYRQKLLRAPASEALAAEIREQLERFSGEAAAYQYAREYAVVLFNLGRSEDAIGVIDTQRLNNRSLGNREREQLLLLKGVIAGKDSTRGREALQELVRSGKTREVSRVALSLLARGRDAATGGLPEFLNEMIARTEPHVLLGEIYYIRSQLALTRAEIALANGNAEMALVETKIAEEDAKRLLEQFPGLQQITSVYRLLAYAALQRTPPQYRAAADFLIQLRDRTELAPARALLNRLIGDCYFLNGDYTNAVDFYQAAHARSIDPKNDGALFLRLITAEVRSGQMEAAIRHIDEADFSGSVSEADRWRAEWNVAQALKANGQLDLALARVRLLLEGASVAGVPGALDMRLNWLEAYLSYSANEDGAALADRVAKLLARVESIPVELLEQDGQLTPVEVKFLITEILLLQAQVLIRSGDANEGTAVLERLRVGYADSSAAQRSYLTESDYHASIDDFQAAQETLTKLASIYPQSVLAPQAIFEAAIYCERRGPEFYAEAVRLHNDIAVNYPADTLVYSARLKQGDLLRKMNDFAGAQIIYENLINTAPTHPRRYIPELSRVDCMLALAKNNSAQLGDVVLALERLMDVPNLPVDFQAEVGYKWGFTLLKRDLPEQAQEVFLLIYSRFLLDADQATQLGATGRYWMSRASLALGTILEESGELVEARRVYRKMVAFNLPGRNLALERANNIQVVEEASAE